MIRAAVKSRSIAFLTAGLLCASVLARAGAQSGAPAGAYGNLDNVRLAQVLGEMGMTSALQQLKAELDKSGDQMSKLVVAAALHIAQSRQLTSPAQADERDKQLDLAAAELRKAVEKEPAAGASATSWMGYLRTRYMLAATLALDRGSRHAQAILGLLGDERDVAALSGLSAEAVYQLDSLYDAAGEKLRDWRGNVADVLTKVPAVEQLLDEFRLDSAWIYLYRGISLPGDEDIEAARKLVEQARTTSGQKRTEILRKALRILAEGRQESADARFDDLKQAREGIEAILNAGSQTQAQDLDRLFRRAIGRVAGISAKRRRVLDRAARLVEPYATNPRAGELKYWSLLLQGVAAREGGDHEEAAKILGGIRQAAAGPNGRQLVPPNLLVEAMFHLARNEIERSGASADAGAAAIDDYRATCLRLTAPAQHGAVEIRASFLKCYLYGRLAFGAKAAEDPEKAALNQLNAASAIFTFEEQYERVAKQMAALAAEGKDTSQLQEQLQKLSGLQTTLFEFMARKFESRLEQENLEPLFKDAVRLAAVVRDMAAAQTPEAKGEILNTLEGILKSPAPADRAGEVGAKAKDVYRRIQTAAHLYAGDALYSLQEGMENGRERWALMRQAAEHWRTIAANYPDHPMAFAAAKNAASCLKNLGAAMTEAGAELTADFYKSYREALTTLLGRWGDREEVQKWYPDLGVVQIKEAGDKFTPEALQDILSAIDSFEKTSRSNPQYMENRFAALSKRNDLLIQKKRWTETLDRCEDAAKRDTLGRALSSCAREDYMVDVLSKYAADAAAMLSGAKDEATRERLRESGSWADVRAAELLYERGQTDANAQLQEDAIKRVQNIQQQWKDTAPAVEAEVLEILWRFERGDTGAVEKLLKVIEERPEEAKRLLGGIYLIRDTSRQMVKSGIRGKYVGRYEQFAKIIYDQMKSRPADDDRRYEATKKYADALAEAGKNSEAMAVWQEAKQIDDARVQKETAKVDAEVGKWLDRMKEAPNSVRVLKEVAKECLQSFATRGTYGAAAGELELYVRRSEDPDTLYKALESACSAYSKLAKEAVPADADVIEGLARCHKTAGDYLQAMTLYEKLVTGLTNEDSRYWVIQREYCECWLNARKGDNEEMKRLATYIRQLGAQNRPGFGELLGEAERLSK